MSHAQIWSAIDSLAQRNGMSVSGLARRAGLDATAFNRSKRFSQDGRPRWPSTESVFKVLAVTGESFDTFARDLDSPSVSVSGNIHSDDVARRFEGLKPGSGTKVPLLGFAEAGDGGFFDDAGFPAGHGWDQIEVPDLKDQQAYALEVSGDSMLPLYRDGDILVVSPSATVRRHDRVVVRTRAGEVLAKVLLRQTKDYVELHSLNPDHDDRRIPWDAIDWMARILWASQ
ncbi:MAG: helix-turn-helix transcriptional regulator [Pseudomonadota bacterium]